MKELWPTNISYSFDETKEKKQRKIKKGEKLLDSDIKDATTAKNKQKQEEEPTFQA